MYVQEAELNLLRGCYISQKNRPFVSFPVSDGGNYLTKTISRSYSTFRAPYGLQPVSSGSSSNRIEISTAIQSARASQRRHSRKSTTSTPSASSSWRSACGSLPSSSSGTYSHRSQACAETSRIASWKAIQGGRAEVSAGGFWR